MELNAMMEQRKVDALAKYLTSDGTVIIIEGDGETYAFGEAEYLVLTGREADRMTADVIAESLWAFIPGFVVGFLPEGVGLEVVKALQATGEDSNGALFALVSAGRGMAVFVSAAIGADGRGHFLSGYDGEEGESDGFYMYRVN